MEARGSVRKADVDSYIKALMVEGLLVQKSSREKKLSAVLMLTRDIFSIVVMPGIARRLKKF